MCCTLLTENTGRKNYAKNRHLQTIAQLCRAISSQLRQCIDDRKRIVKQQYLLHMSLQYGELRYYYIQINLGVHVDHRRSHCGCRVCTDPKILDVGVRHPNVLADPRNNTIILCLIEIMGLLKHFAVILVYALYNSFSYIRESSSIWSHTHTSPQNACTKGKRVGHETKIARRDL